MIRFKVQEKPVRMNVRAANPVDMGRYYIPKVSEDGWLTWEPSVPGMQPVDAENIRGPAMTFEDLTPEQKEELRGKSGVYVGAGELPDGYNVQIEPGGKATDIGSQYTNKLLYINSDGQWTLLTIGAGLKIVNGVLMVVGTVTPDDNKTTSLLGKAVLGDMILGA